MEILVSILVAVLALGCGWLIRDRSMASARDTSKDDDEAGDSAPTEKPEGIYKVAEDLKSQYRQSAHVEDAKKLSAFVRGVDLLQNEADDDALLAYLEGDNDVITAMALVAIEGRASIPFDRLAGSVINLLNGHDNKAKQLGLRLLDRRADGPVLPKVLATLDYEWETGALLSAIERFAESRLAAKEVLDWSAADQERLSDNERRIRTIVKQFKKEMRDPILDSLKKRSKLNLEYLRGVGQVFTKDSEVPPVENHPTLERALQDIRRVVTQKRTPNSLLLSGAAGTGKSSTLLQLARELVRDGWTVFRADAPELNAGQMYIGQLEERMKRLIRELSRPRVVWIIDQFQQLLLTGTHKYSGVSALDMLLPHIENGSVRIVGELGAGALEQIAARAPRLADVVEIVRLTPLPTENTAALLERWLPGAAGTGRTVIPAPEAISEALRMVRQYFPAKELPGAAFDFLKTTCARLVSASGEDTEIRLETSDLIATLAQVSGMPKEIVDDAEVLDLEKLRQLFDRQVLGQPEAVTTLVDRVAMIKAGLTDPGRPLGVFLFAGPTGTGKTQVAKALTTFLFGSAERMIRLDMSEFQGPGSVGRLIGEKESDTPHTLSLVNSVRRQPFSLILLDEFEKADPQVWDFFLQVFDEGRLTDRQGLSANFRNTIIILTSNLGAREAQQAGLGFLPVNSGFDPGEFLKMIGRTFRPEFVNRLDRVVVFNPLSRETMRQIMALELEKLQLRSGLRRQPWLIEFDESALEFLLEKGFTPSHGARPLRRAIDEHFLAPLSLAVVSGEVAEGEALLMVTRCGDRLDLEWVPLDEPPAEPVPEPGPPEEQTGLGSLITHPRGRAEEVATLRLRLDELDGLLRLERFVEKKESALREMSTEGFWQSPARFQLLSQAEYIDRVEATLRSMRQLLGRFPDGGAPSLVVREVASKIFLLETAYPEIVEGKPQDAFLRIESPDAEWRGRLAEMYAAWATERRMQWRELGVDATSSTFAADGYAAHAILSGESGLHVLQAGENETLHSALVRVAPQPTEPLEFLGLTALEAARKALAGEAADPPRTVRRYQEHPTPLVRDRIRGWRTGKFDLVLAGNFDVMGI